MTREVFYNFKLGITENHVFLQSDEEAVAYVAQGREPQGTYWHLRYGGISIRNAVLAVLKGWPAPVQPAGLPALPVDS